MSSKHDEALNRLDPIDGAVEPAPLSREQLRSRRHRDVRARTISTKRMTKRDLEIGRALYPADEHADVARPRTRGDCADVPRPCPFVACRHHLYLDVSARTGAIKLNFPDVEPDELTESCALDVAERGETTLEEVGAIMNLTRERIRQVAVSSMASIEAAAEMRGLRDLVDGGTKRRLPLLDDDQEAEERDDACFGEPEDETIDADEFASEDLDSE